MSKLKTKTKQIKPETCVDLKSLERSVFYGFTIKLDDSAHMQKSYYIPCRFLGPKKCKDWDQPKTQMEDSSMIVYHKKSERM